LDAFFDRNDDPNNRRWTLADFSTGQALGKGRFGNVYLARERASDTRVAFKVLFKSKLLQSHREAAAANKRAAQAARMRARARRRADRGPSVQHGPDRTGREDARIDRGGAGGDAGPVARPGFRRQLSGLDLLRREVEIQRGLVHPNIVRLLGHFFDKNNICLVLEYCSGGTVYAELQRTPRGRFSEHRAAAVVAQTAEALAYCHANRIVHRDLKPENLLLAPEGDHAVLDAIKPREAQSRKQTTTADGDCGNGDREKGDCERGDHADGDHPVAPVRAGVQPSAGRSSAKLADFGWAVSVRDGRPRRTVCGTPAYLSPEMVAGSPHGTPVDIWALGTLAYELLTGGLPFEGRTNEETYERISSGELEFPGRSVFLSQGAEAFVRACLAREPESRPTAEGVLAHPWIRERSQEKVSLLQTSGSAE
jgi:serine/threonine protein kinase